MHLIVLNALISFRFYWVLILLLKEIVHILSRYFSQEIRLNLKMKLDYLSGAPNFPRVAEEEL